MLALIGAVALGLIVRIAFPFDVGPPELLVSAFVYFISINIFLALFNLLPIPPFDGSHVIEGLLPPAAARVYDRIRPLGFPLLFVLLVAVPYVFPGLGIIERVVLPPVEWAMGQYLGLAQWIAGG